MDGGVLEADRGDVEVDEGVWGGTGGVWVDKECHNSQQIGKGRFFYIKDKIPPSAHFSILSAQIACF